MNKAILRIQTRANTPFHQRGMLTTFTGVMILVLLTLMMFFAIRVGVFEQRVSANDSRQKLAFHTAESGIAYAKEFFLANSVLITKNEEDFLGDGSDGWFFGDSRWELCPAGIDADESHPCNARAVINPQTEKMYFYNVDENSFLPIQPNDVLPGDTEKVEVQALLCVLEMVNDDEIPVKGCSELDVPQFAGDPSGNYFMLTVLARGGADCVGNDSVKEDCNAMAMISEQVSNFGATGGGNSPDVPLTTKSSFPPIGTAEIVPNPNAGGIGVPVSVWMNDNESCSSGEVAELHLGSWSTCEMHEWYGVDKKPDDMACSGNCICSEAESISSKKHNSTEGMGIDLVVDEEFPCDLFQFYFGVPSTNYEVVKSTSQIISDCDSLDESSFGVYWVTGPECYVNSNTVIGSKNSPVLLISAAGITRFAGGANFFGVLFVTDVEDPNAELQALGTNTVYGSVINDATLGNLGATFQVVWAEDVSEKAGNGGGLGNVLGGWSDFHQDWE